MGLAEAEFAVALSLPVAARGCLNGARRSFYDRTAAHIAIAIYQPTQHCTYVRTYVLTDAEEKALAYQTFFVYTMLHAT